MPPKTFIFSRKKTLVWVTIILLSGWAQGTLRAQDTLTLERAIALALEKNYSIRIAEKRIDIALNDNTRGNAGFLPTVAASAQKNFTSSHLRQEFFNALQAPLDRAGVNNNNSNSGATLNWWTPAARMPRSRSKIL